VPEYTAAYLARNHNRTTREERRYIQRYIDGLGDLAREVSDVRFPDPNDPPYDEIAVRYDSLRCIGRGADRGRYSYIVSAIQKI
jgi:hypothetical protein